jgi:hypothetical protein
MHVEFGPCVDLMNMPMPIQVRYKMHIFSVRRIYYGILGALKTT